MGRGRFDHPPGRICGAGVCSVPPWIPAYLCRPDRVRFGCWRVALFCVYVARRKMGFDWPWPDLRLARLLGHIREAAPIGLTELSWAFMWYFCTVLLGFIFSDASLGWFGASHRVLMAFAHLRVALLLSTCCHRFRAVSSLPHKHLLELMDRSVRLTAWTGLFGAALLTVLARELLTLVYGSFFARFGLLVFDSGLDAADRHAERASPLHLDCIQLSEAIAVLYGYLGKQSP